MVHPAKEGKDFCQLERLWPLFSGSLDGRLSTKMAHIMYHSLDRYKRARCSKSVIAMAAIYNYIILMALKLNIGHIRLI